MRISDWSSDVCSSDLINYPFVDPDLSLGAVEAALARNKLSVIGITPEIYTRRFAKGAFTNPDPDIRRLANEMVNDAAHAVRRFGADYVKLWPGQDGCDYPFQVDHKALWRLSTDGIGALASPNPELKLDRKSVGEDKSVSVRVDLGARRLIQKKKT